MCCGSAGLYNLEQPEMAAELGARKAAALAASGAAIVATGNIGCLTQLETALAAAGAAIRLRHTMELLAEASVPGSARCRRTTDARASRLRQRRARRRRARRPHRDRHAASRAAAGRSRRGAARGAGRADRPAAARHELVRAGQRVAISVCDITRAQPRRADARGAVRGDAGSAAGGRHHPHRHRHASRQHRRGAGADARRGDRRALPGGEPRRPRRPVAGLRRHARRPTCRSGSTGTGSTPTCASPPGSSSRTSSPASAAGRRWSRPGLAGLATTLVLHDARHIGHPKATWGITEGNPVHDDVREIARMTGVTLRARRRAQPRSGDHPRLRRRAVRRARGGVRARQAHGDARGRGAVRRGADHQLRLSARPEPLPDGEGHVGGGVHRQATAARSSAPPSAATAFPTHGPYGRAAARALVARQRCSRWSRRRGSPSRTPGRCRCRRSSSARPGCWVKAGGLSPRAAARRALRAGHRRRHGGAPGAGRRRAPARRWPCCPTARRRFPICA